MGQATQQGGGKAGFGAVVAPLDWDAKGWQKGGSQPQTKVYAKTKLCVNFAAGHCPRGDTCGFAHGEEELGSPQPGVIPGLSLPPPKEARMQGGDLPKTKLCTHFEKGYCPRGDTCGFAHGAHEIGTARPSHSAMAAASAMFKKGGCGGGAPGGCQDDMGMLQLTGPSFFSTQQAVGGGGGCAGGGGFGGGGGCGGGKVKTKLCHHWANGTCTRGSMCGFAHGEQELGQLVPLDAAGNNWQPPSNFGSSFQQQSVQQQGGSTSSAEKDLFNFKTTLCSNFVNTGSCPRGERCNFAHSEAELMEPGQAKAVVEQMEQQGHVF